MDGASNDMFPRWFKCHISPSVPQSDQDVQIWTLSTSNITKYGISGHLRSSHSISLGIMSLTCVIVLCVHTCMVKYSAVGLWANTGYTDISLSVQPCIIQLLSKIGTLTMFSDTPFLLSQYHYRHLKGCITQLEHIITLFTFIIGYGTPFNLPYGISIQGILSLHLGASSPIRGPISLHLIINLPILIVVTAHHHLVS